MGISREDAGEIGRETGERIANNSISEGCYSLAGSLFGAWVFIDAARRYAGVEEKEKALSATINARAAIYDCEKEASLSPDETKAINDELNTVIHTIEWREFPEARDRLETLSEQVFKSSLEKVVDCECPKKK